MSLLNTPSSKNEAPTGVGAARQHYSDADERPSASSSRICSLHQDYRITLPNQILPHGADFGVIDEVVSALRRHPPHYLGMYPLDTASSDFTIGGHSFD